MNNKTAILQTVSSNPWFIFVTGVATLLGFMGYVYEKFDDPKFYSLSILLLFLGMLVLLWGIAYSIKIRLDNKALMDVSELFYEINRLYKDSLSECFTGIEPIHDEGYLQDKERHTLQAVCQRIENIFARLINSNCMSTVKLVIEKNDGYTYAETLTRSQNASLRDSPPKSYKIGDGSNTAFDVAIRPSKGKPSHFFSKDLTKEDDYFNERQNYKSFYKSTIVVPISSSADDGHIGYLTIDTKSVNKLNGRFHVYIMASLAQQMYNYMSLMRGGYLVWVWEKDYGNQ